MAFISLKKDKRITEKGIVISLIVFILLWGIMTDAWGYSKFLFVTDTREWFAGSYIYGYVIRLLWSGPAFLLIYRHRRYLKIKVGDLFSHPKINRSLIIVLSISFIYCFISMFISHGSFWVDRSAPVLAIILKFIIVGIVEEVVFRGWGYNALASVVSNKKAVMISSTMFVAVHWPAFFIRFYLSGVFDWSGFISQSITALLWGVIFCWLLKKSKSLLNPIIAHTVYDCFVTLLIG